MFDGSIEEVTGTTMKLLKALKEFEEVKNEDTEHEDKYAEVNGIKKILKIQRLRMKIKMQWSENQSPKSTPHMPGLGGAS